MVVNSEHWLGRLLLRAEGNITVVSPDSAVDMLQRTAVDVLGRYANKSGN
jgi:predicted DNA-binding transcriptional regulator YafY